jgi:hypothetical protein
MTLELLVMHVKNILIPNFFFSSKCNSTNSCIDLLQDIITMSPQKLNKTPLPQPSPADQSKRWKAHNPPHDDGKQKEWTNSTAAINDSSDDDLQNKEQQAESPTPATNPQPHQPSEPSMASHHCSHTPPMSNCHPILENCFKFRITVPASDPKRAFHTLLETVKKVLAKLWEADNYVCCNSSMVFQLFIEAHQFTG